LSNVALRAADRVRRMVVVPVARAAPGVAVSRERRVVVLGCIGIVLSLAATLWAPLALLAIGPLVFGVPHLVADARYLVFRPRLHRVRALAPAVAVVVGGLALGFGVRAGLAASAIAALFANGSLVRRASVAGIAIVLLGVAHTAPFMADVVFFHAHNLVAIAIWLAWRPSRARFVVPIVFVFASALLACLATPAFAPHWSGLSFASLGETLAPGATIATTARLVSFFAFAQSVHYVVWLRLVPEDDRPQPTPRSYVQSTRALVADIGRPVAIVALAVFVGICIIALARLSLARDVYLGIAYGHGHVEIVAAAWLVSGGRRR
jgi:hypothetical protein